MASPLDLQVPPGDLPLDPSWGTAPPDRPPYKARTPVLAMNVSVLVPFSSPMYTVVHTTDIINCDPILQTICCHHCVFFHTKMYQNRFWPGLCCKPPGGAYDASPDTIIGRRREPLPISLPFDAFGASTEGPSGRVPRAPKGIKNLRWPYANHCVILAAVKAKK